MKKSLLIAGLLLTGTTGAWAQSLFDLHEPHRWYYDTVKSAVYNMHAGAQNYYDFEKYFFSHTFRDVFSDMSVAGLCDEYEAACRVHEIIQKPCEKFIETIVRTHNAKVEYIRNIGNMSKDEMSWEQPDKAVNVTCHTGGMWSFCPKGSEGMPRYRYELFLKACGELEAGFYDAKCHGASETTVIQVSPRELYEFCVNSKLFKNAYLYAVDSSEHNVCYDLVGLFIEYNNVEKKYFEHTL